MKNLHSIKSLFESKSARYYQNYASMFKSYYNIDPKQLQILDKAGFYIFISTYLFDKVIDKHKNTNETMFDSLLAYDKSIEVLNTIFDKNHEFWTYWDLRKKEWIFSFREEEVIKQEWRLNLL